MVIITLSVLLLIAYVFDLTSSKTKIPSVILLLLTGWAVKQATTVLHINLPDLSPILPELGSIGLILIVLEGSLELELNSSKGKVIGKTFLGVLFTMGATAFLFAYVLHAWGLSPFKSSLINAIPFCVISSAIAIPSVRNITLRDKEFVIYESSFSDIIGVLFFNFIALNDTLDTHSLGHFGLQLLVILVVSFVATIGLSFLLSKIDHHVKFVPITLLVILIYEVSKIYHLPALIFILLFGLFIGNLDELKRFKWIEKFRPEILNREVQKFKELTFEAAFLVRALFFMLFGYLIETSEILNTETLLWAFLIVMVIFFFRALQLKLSMLPLKPLLFVAPRGLITILLFLSIEPAHSIALVNRSLIIQVIILSALIMMFGLMISNKKKNVDIISEQDAEVVPGD